MQRLLIRKSSGPSTEMVLDGERYAIGRATDNDIVLEGAGVSRHHCVIERDGEQYRIRDLDSHNGVYINGQNVREAVLTDRDQIRIGSNVLQYGSGRQLDVSTTVSFEQDYDELAMQLRAAVHAAFGPDVTPLDQLQKERRTLSLLCDLSRTLSTVQSLEDVSRKALEMMLEITPAERGAIFLLENGALKPAMVCHRPGSKEAGEAVVLSSTLADRILTERKGIITADAAEDPRFAHGQSVVLRGLHSIACTPLIGKEGNLGILYIENPNIGAFRPDDLELLVAVAAQIGLTIENARFFDALRRYSRDLEQLVEERTRALRETQAKLYQTEKRVSLSRLVAGVAHEINSPLGALKSNLELLRSVSAAHQPPDDGREREVWSETLDVLDQSVGACTRIMGVVRSLRAYARLDESEFKVADINEGLAAAIELLDPALRRSVQLDVRLGEIPPIPCFPALLNQAFMNLLVNACEACQRVTGERRVAVETAREGDRVVLRIRDTGAGIAPEHLPKIFDPGFTTKGVGVGVGLGLSIADSVIREHRGTIEVESTPGAGSRFTVRLPIA